MLGYSRLHSREWFRTATVQVTDDVPPQRFSIPKIWALSYLPTHNPATSCCTTLAACTANSGSDDPIWKMTMVHHAVYELGRLPLNVLRSDERHHGLTERFLHGMTLEDRFPIPALFRISDHPGSRCSYQRRSVPYHETPRPRAIPIMRNEFQMTLGLVLLVGHLSTPSPSGTHGRRASRRR